jgi:hypothetical protein
LAVRRYDDGMQELELGHTGRKRGDVPHILAVALADLDVGNPHR